MHRLNSNHVDPTATSALGDESVTRIKQGLAKAAARRQAKRGEPQRKTAARQTVVPASQTTVKVASIAEIPADFERIGTGFFRRGHHLWQLTTTNDGYELVRKHEDHVLGDEPMPVARPGAQVTDRRGHVLTAGRKVQFPHHGKMASGTIIIIQPNSLGVETMSGEQIALPPDMVETMPGEQEAEMMAPGSEFTPNIEPSSKADQGAPEPTEPPGSPEPPAAEPPSHEPPKPPQAAADDEPEDGASESDDGPPEHSEPPSHSESDDSQDEGPESKTAQTDMSTPSEGQQPSAPKPSQPSLPSSRPDPDRFRQERQVGIDTGTHENLLATSNLYKQLMANQGRLYVMTEGGDLIVEIEFAEGGDSPTFRATTLMMQPQTHHDLDVDGFLEYEKNLGNYRVMTNKISSREAAIAAKQLFDEMVGHKLQDWTTYWRAVGQRVAAAPRKPMTPEQREERKERRKQRKLERQGLPPGVKLPSKRPSKGAAVDAPEEMEMLKERLRLHEQFLDEVEYILQDESLRTDEQRLTQELEQAITNYHEDATALEQSGEAETEDELSLDTPPEEGVAEVPPAQSTPKLASKIVVSMGDL